MKSTLPTTKLRHCSITPFKPAVYTPTTTRPVSRTALRTYARQKDNVLTVGLVSLMTETLRLLGVGKKRYQEVAARPSRPGVAKGDVTAIMQRISGDFEQAYIVTGIIDDSVYDGNCFFADPTVSFSGVELWKRNLQLLVPFLIDPRVQMLSIKQGAPDQQQRTTLKAEWRLSTYLSFPWRPRIDILGSTVYTLNEDSDKVVEHVEAWNVSGVEAIMQMFKPSERSVWATAQQRNT
eukprot:jgi/Chrzof1/14105/Cz08g25090.t1